MQVVKRSVHYLIIPASMLYSVEIHGLSIHQIYTHTFAVLFGYPPKELPDYNPLLTLESLGIKSGDTVTLEELKSERQRMIEFKDVNRTQPNTSDIASSTSANASQNFNSSNSKEKESKHSEVVILNSSEGNTGAGHSVFSGTKRELDHASGAALEPSSSQKRSGKLSRK